jgi:hypothetical protein
MAFNQFTIILTIGIVVFSVLYAIWISFQNRLIKQMGNTGILLEVVLEKDTEKDPFSMEQVWSTFHGGMYIPWYKRIFKAQPYITFEIKSENDAAKKKKEITFNFWVPRIHENLVRSRILGLYHNAQINVVKNDYIPDENDRMRVIATAELGLREHSAFSLRTFEDYTADPLQSITSVMTELENKEIAVVQVIARPYHPSWRKRAARVLERYEKTGKKPSHMPEWTGMFQSVLFVIFAVIDAFIGKQPEIKVDTKKSSVDSQKQKEMLEKVSRMPFSFQIRVLVGTPMGKEDAQERVGNIVAAFRELEGANNGLKKEFIIGKHTTYKKMKQRFLNYSNNDDILSTVELASFCHLPNKDMMTPGLKKTQSKQAQSPVNVSNDNAFAKANFRGVTSDIGLDELARMRHVYCSGMTGVGKSVLLENMIINDIESGRGCVVIDPHGELIDTVLEKISTDREDVFVLDPADISFPFGMNLLELTTADPIRRELEKVLVVDAYITTMKRVFSEGSIGANTDDIFRMSCSAILDHPEGGGLLEMLLMLTSDRYRNGVLQFIKDPVVANYWEVVFPALAGQGKFLVANLNAPLNKIRRFIANGLVANIICQKKSTLNVAEAINSGAVILARFSRGDMGFENSALLGAMLIAKVQIAAMQRVSIPMEQRVPTFLYVDEFQNFVGDSSGAQSFGEILSEARKYKLGLVIANQFIDQLKQGGSTYLMSAIFNNCGTTITFRVGVTDAKFFEEIYFDKDTNVGFKAADLANADKYQVIMRIMTKDGVQSQPFTASTLPPVTASKNANPQKIRDRSRARICVPREVIRKDIQRRMQMDTLSDVNV